MKTPSPIISLFARGREIGFVLLERGTIVRFGVKTVKGRRQGQVFVERVERALVPLLEQAVPSGMVVVEQRAPGVNTGALARTIFELAEQWREKGYRIRFTSLGDAKQKLLEDRKMTQRELVEVVATKHSLLWPLIADAKAEKVKYWHKVVIAAALANVFEA